MRLPIHTVLAVAIILLPGLAQAQRPQGPPAGGAPATEVVGVVRSPKGAPVEAASVSVFRADGSLANGALTDAEGRFRLEGLRPGRYTVRIGGLGYETVTREIALTAASPRVDLGEIRLAASGIALEGITVTGERQTVALAPDRNSYDVSEMPAVEGGSTVDVLRNVPALEVDIDGRVSLRGNENVVVQINGRPSPLRGEQLGSFLAQLPANMVERVDVIPNPSARHDPEGMAGIVNVVLRRNTDLGTSGGVTASAGTTGQLNLSGNLGHQQGPLTLFANYGFMRDERRSSGHTYRENRYLQPLTILEQESTGKQFPLSHSFNGSADYRLSRTSTLSSNLVLSNRDHARENENLYRELSATGAPINLYERVTESESDNFNLDYSLALRRVVQPRSNELSAEVRFNRSAGTDEDVYRQNPLSGAVPARQVERNLGTDRSRNLTIQTDLVRAIGDRTLLETGYRGNLRQLDNALEAFISRAPGAPFEEDLTRSNAFEFAEWVHAVYGVASGSLGRLDLQAGLRLERAHTEFELETTGEAFDNAYASFFPSGLVAYNLSDTRQVKASYSKRIERPRTRLLNPFNRSEDPLNVFRGNPSLRPEYTHSFELGFQQSGELGTLQVSPFFRRTTNAVRRLQTLEEGGVTLTTFENIATRNSYGGDVTGSLRLGPVRGFGGISAYQVVTDASNLNVGESTSAFGWSARMNATYGVTPSLDVQAFYMFRAPMRTEQGRTGGRSMMNVAARQRLGERASLNLRVVDPFNTMGFGFVTDTEQFYQETERSFGARGVYLSFTYTVGRQPQRRGRPDSQEEVPRDDLEIP